MKYNKSINAFKESQALIPGGVNSPVRAFKSVNAILFFLIMEKEVKFMILTVMNILTAYLHGVHLFLDMLIRLHYPKLAII